MGGTQGNLLFNNTITTLWSSASIRMEATINSNITSNIGISNSGTSLYLNEVSNTTVRNNNFTSTSGRGTYTFNQAYNNVFINNTVRSWSSSYSALEIASGSDNVSLINNTAICNSTGSAIVVSYTDYAYLEGNNATNYYPIAGGYGIFINDCQNNTLTNNIANHLGPGEALLLILANNTRLVNNTGWCYGDINNICPGIQIIKSSNTTLFSNRGKGNYFYGILISNSANSNFTNNNGTSYYGGPAIAISSSPNSNFINNTGTSDFETGFYIEYMSNSTFINNTGKSLLTFGLHGFDIKNSVNNTFINITATSIDQAGIYLRQSSNNTFINSTAITTNGSVIFLSESINNTFLNQIARTTGSTGNFRTAIYMGTSNNTLFRDCINISGASYHVYIDSNLGSFNNTFFNCSYDLTNVSKERVLGSTNQLIREWYYKAYVNYSNGSAAVGANVTAYNVSSSLQFTENTNASGWIQRKEVIEYNNTGGTRTFYNNYTINANKSGTANEY